MGNPEPLAQSDVPAEWKPHPVKKGRGHKRPKSPYNRRVGNYTKVPPGPWDRVEGEATLPYQAFDVYRRLGPTRSIDKAYQVLKELKLLRRRTKGKPGQGAKSDKEVQNVVDSHFRAGLQQESSSPMNTHASRDGSQPVESYVETYKHTHLPVVEKRKQRAGQRIYTWSRKFRWVERARAWDDWVYQQAKEVEVELRRQDQIERAELERRVRQEFQQILLALVKRIRVALESDVWYAPREIKELTLAAEKAGLVRDNAFKNVRDLLEEAEDGTVLSVEVSARLTEEMARVAMELAGNLTPLPAQVQVPGGALPAPDQVVLDVEVTGDA